MSDERFSIVERSYGDNEDGLSVGIANIHAAVPDVQANKDTIVQVAQTFAERGVDYALFPEFCLSGYFWEEEADCREYMDSALTDEHTDWIEGELRPLLDDDFTAIVLNNLRRGPDGKYLNSTFLVAEGYDYGSDESTYDKVFVPGIEKTHTQSGRDDRLVIDSESAGARLGFTTCYDYLFNDLLREYTLNDEVDAVIQIASWRAAATRDYPGMNVRTDAYYGELWDKVMAANSATNQVWTIACNAVGQHAISGATFWGGSGVWAPSGLELVQASHVNEELLIVHNLDIQGARDSEEDEFDYSIDFKEIYRPLEDSRGFTREIG
ncbi:MAG: carbon-nitrogen hydrolase family protein [Actinomycetota bacterium]|nr:carbon-nitrogen hydrolase family protein [Actinomycetota bacterium]